MSAYQGRTGPNYTEYLNNLNSASPLEEDSFNTDLDLQSLEMFTNTNFTHHDMAQEENFNFDLNNDADMKYAELLTSDAISQPFNQPLLGNPPNDTQFFSSYNTPIQQAPAHGFPPLEGQSPIPPTVTGATRKADGMQPSGMTPDEKSRVVAEEDKRRRNTAASARFRVKKKQREQALEKSTKEVNEKNAKLEAKVSQLEMENKWLKDLITEKNAIQSREELEIRYMEFKRESEEREGEHTSGVGTE